MSPNEPRTNNPGLGNYIGRTAGVAVYLAIILAFTAVHFFYATSALLDLLAVFILFIFLFFLGLSLTCLALCARVGPGDLPSRFSAARMETFIRAELQRIVARARPAAPAAAERAKAAGGKEEPLNGAATTTTTTVVPKQQQRWADIDAAEEHQLANSASLAAMAERASPTAAAVAWERAAAEARLRVQEERIDLSSSEAEGDEEGHDEERRKRRRRRQQQQHGSPQEGDGVVQEDGSIANSADDEPEVQELPAYMPEMMRLRRLRKLRRGLDVVRVSDAARKVLEALDSDDFDRKREEMGYLIPGANWCRFCSFYQMNDTRHCTVCCRCVYRTKLHCVCCGSCIGYANSKYYVLFLFYFVLAFLMANFLDLYCINTGYTYFFKASGESNSVYYLVFVYSYSLVVLAFSLLVQYLLAAGRNVGLLTELLRQQREELESVQVRNSGELYQPVLSERTADIHDDGNSSPEQTREPFSWQRAMKTVGEGLPLPMWFWPVPTRPAVKEMDDPEGFWTNLTEAIRIRLRSVADEDDVFTDEDEAMESHHDNDAGDADVRVQPTFAAVAAATAAAAAAPRLPPAPMPHHAKSSDVTVVPVPPPAEPDTDVAVAIAAEDRQSHTPVSAVTPPIAKAAPAARVKKD